MSTTVFDNAPPPAPRASISVIVLSHNSGRFIAEALDSILGQTVQPEQIVVVDVGSTDASSIDNGAAVVGKYSDRRIQYLRQPNGGVASARNAGLDAVKCDFIAFLDADDRWRPTFLETMYGFLAEDPAVACVFGNFVRFQDSTGELLRDQFHLYPEIKRPALLRDAPNAHGRIPKEKAFSVLVRCGEIPAYPQAMMFRRSLIESLRFEPSLAFGEQILFALQTFMRGSVVFTDEVLAEVRRHQTDATDNYGEIAVHELGGLKALAPQITRDIDLVAYRDRLVKAHVDAALYQTKQGRVRAGLRTLRDSFAVPGSSLRKLQGSARMVLALPQGMAK